MDPEIIHGQKLESWHLHGRPWQPSFYHLFLQYRAYEPIPLVTLDLREHEDIALPYMSCFPSFTVFEQSDILKSNNITCNQVLNLDECLLEKSRYYLFKHLLALLFYCHLRTLDTHSWVWGDCTVATFKKSTITISAVDARHAVKGILERKHIWRSLLIYSVNSPCT